MEARLMAGQAGSEKAVSGDCIAVVPARGGSKGIPRKNLVRVGGASLVAWAVRAGREAGLPVILSTDDPEIRAEGVAAGAQAPFLRPPHLATDTATTVDVLNHVIDWYETSSGRRVAAVATLQPTSPLRTGEDVAQALGTYHSRPEGCRSLITLSPASHLNPTVLYHMQEDGTARVLDPNLCRSRHERPQLFIRNGAIYISERDLLMQEGVAMCAAPTAYVMPRWRGVNIDDYFDLYLAQVIATHPPTGTALSV
jgi:CMP-N-acetylneuraminic acid synthetase